MKNGLIQGARGCAIVALLSLADVAYAQVDETTAEAAAVAVAEGGEATSAAPALDMAEFEGEMLYASNGRRVAAVYNVTDSGIPQVIYRGALYSIPPETLTLEDGRLTTSLSKKEIIKLSG